LTLKLVGEPSHFIRERLAVVFLVGGTDITTGSKDKVGLLHVGQIRREAESGLIGIIFAPSPVTKGINNLCAVVVRKIPQDALFHILKFTGIDKHRFAGTIT